MIERGKNSPTVSTLCRVSDALGIPISSLFASEPEQSDVVFISRSSRARVPFTRGLWEGLGGERFSGSVEPFALTLESGSNSGPFPITHTGHEFVYCIRGQLEYQVQGEIFELKSGDSLLFSSHLQHRWRNPGPTVTDVIFVLAGFEGEEPLGVQHLANPSQNS
jgi:mannose-6-phosphate isomerase-like protein (cupin superfamily)